MAVVDPFLGGDGVGGDADAARYAAAGMPENVVQQQLRQVDAFFQAQIAAADSEARRLAPQPPLRVTISSRMSGTSARRPRMLGLESFAARSVVVQVRGDCRPRRPSRGADHHPVGRRLGGARLLFVPRTAAGIRSPSSARMRTLGRNDSQVREGQAVCRWLQTAAGWRRGVYVPQSIERMNDHPYCQRIKAAVGQSDSPGKDRRWILYRLGYVVGHTMPGLDVQDVLAAVDYLATAARCRRAADWHRGHRPRRHDRALRCGPGQPCCAAAVVMDYFAIAVMRAGKSRSIGGCPVNCCRAVTRMWHR